MVAGDGSDALNANDAREGNIGRETLTSVHLWDKLSTPVAWMEVGVQCSPALLMPKPSILIRTCPGWGTGRGTSCNLRTETGPGVAQTTARIDFGKVAMIEGEVMKKKGEDVYASGRMAVGESLRH